MQKFNRSAASIHSKKLNKSIKTTDIKYNVAPPTPPAFVKGNTFCTGTADDIYLQRLNVYSKVIFDYKDYFIRLMSAEMDLAHVYARIGDALTLPFSNSTLLLTKDNPNSIHAAVLETKSCQQNQVDFHLNFSNYLKTIILPKIKTIEEQNKNFISAYKVTAGFITGQLTSCDLVLEKNAKALNATCLDRNADILTKNAGTDPLFQVIEIAQLIIKKKSIMGNLQATAKKQLTAAHKYEINTIEALKCVLADFYQYKTNSLKILVNSFSGNFNSIYNINPDAEYNHFIKQFEDIIQNNTIQITKMANMEHDNHINESETLIQDQIYILFKNYNWSIKQVPTLHYLKNKFCIIKQGAIAIQEKTRLFKKSYHRANMILTSAGYLHIYLQKTTSPLSTFTTIKPANINIPSKKNPNTEASYSPSSDTTGPSFVTTGSFYHTNKHSNNSDLCSRKSSSKKYATPSSSPSTALGPELPPKSKKSLVIETDSSNDHVNIHFSSEKNQTNDHISPPDPPQKINLEFKKVNVSKNTTNNNNLDSIRAKTVDIDHSMSTNLGFDIRSNQSINQKLYLHKNAHSSTSVKAPKPDSTKQSYNNFPIGYYHDNQKLEMSSSIELKSNNSPIPIARSTIDSDSNIDQQFIDNLNLSKDKTLSPDSKYTSQTKPIHDIAHSLDIAHIKSNLEKLKLNNSNIYSVKSSTTVHEFTANTDAEITSLSYNEQVLNPDITFFIPQSRYRIVGSSLLSIHYKTFKAVLFDSEADIASWYSSLQNIEAQLMYRF
ncbi:hypothetical protein BB561_002321 [Smittium simulii]|uniref:PH domain-containing protein n=1 Tax=Smittium simulii TaxID=133385 RepID=A0A2T9YQX9_9FUNG|nr:hypothetical protein BB561_002321 [Smittium simulii]